MPCFAELGFRRPDGRRTEAPALRRGLLDQPLRRNGGDEGSAHRPRARAWATLTAANVPAEPRTMSSAARRPSWLAGSPVDVLARTCCRGVGAGVPVAACTACCGLGLGDGLATGLGLGDGLGLGLG